MENQQQKPRLHNFWRSGASWRVRIALHWKKIDYEYIAVNLTKGEQKEEKYASKNPSMLVPALEIDGHTLTESIAIIEYLDETRPDHPLLPKNPYERAKVRQISETIASGIQPLQNLKVLNYIGEKKMEWAKHWVTSGFESLEKILHETSGKYCFGDSITMADCCLVPQVYSANRFGVDMSKFPIIARVHKELTLVPEFISAHADKCPDKTE